MNSSRDKNSSSVTDRLAWASRLVWLTARTAMDWVGRHELPVLVGMLVLVGCIWGFIEIADEVMEGDTEQFDKWAVRALRVPGDLSTPIGPKWLHEVGRDFTALGASPS